MGYPATFQSDIPAPRLPIHHTKDPDPNIRQYEVNTTSRFPQDDPAAWRHPLNPQFVVPPLPTNLHVNEPFPSDSPPAVTGDSPNGQHDDAVDPDDPDELHPKPSVKEHMDIDSHSNTAPFIRRLFDAIQDPKTDHVVKWGENGKFFIVLDKAAFVAALKNPNGSGTDKFDSIHRQLINYGIYKRNRDPPGKSKPGKYHEVNGKLLRNRPDLLHEIFLKPKTSTVAEALGGGVLSPLPADNAAPPDPVPRLVEALQLQENAIATMQTQIN
ncbi:hypothetical protein FRB98_000429, partial [Tulasnella sp. 332]